MKTLILGLTLALVSPFVMAKEDAASIMKKSHLASYYAGKDGSSQLLMKVYDSKGGEPIKKLFNMLRLNVKEGGEQMFFTYFAAPADIKGTTFLVHKFIDKDDFRRLYLPASDKVLAIAGSRKQDPFMGSDFSYEDVSGRHFSKDNHKMVSEDDKQYIIESTPKEKEDKISKIKYWINKSNFVPEKVEFYNHDGKVARTYESKKVENIDGVATITSRVMTSNLEGTHTEILVNPKKTKYGVGLSEDVFTERSLKNPPVKFMQ